MPKHLTTLDEILFQSNILKQPSHPENPLPNQVWMDTSKEPNILFRWDGTKWIPVGFQKDDGTIQIIEDLKDQIDRLIDDIDTKADKESILQKVKEIEDNLASKVDGEFVDGKLIIANNEIDAKLKDLAAKLDEKVNDKVFTDEVTGIINSLKEKADLEFVNGQLISKADKDNTFTKEETINALNSKVSKTEYTTDKEGIVKQLTDQESRVTQTEAELKATVKKTDYEADQKGVADRLTQAESALTQTAEQISSTVKKTDYELDKKNINDSLAGKAGADELGLLANRVTKNESAITQTAEEIASTVKKTTYEKDLKNTNLKMDQMGLDLDNKASKNDLNSAVIRITEAESSIKQNADEIASTVKKTEYDKDQQGVTTRLTNAESKITQQAGLIESTVTKTELQGTKDALDKKIDDNNTATTQRFVEAESRITQTEKDITSTVKKVDYDIDKQGIVSRLDTTESQIKQTQIDITSKVSNTKYTQDQTTLNTRVSNAESQIKQQSDLIESKVTKTDYEKDQGTTLNRLTEAESKITQQAGLIESRVTKTEYEVNNKEINDKIEAVKVQAGDGEAINTRFVQAESRITQTEKDITTMVKKTAYETDQQGVISRISKAESRLTQTESDITARVVKSDFDNSMKGKLDVSTFNSKVAEIKATTDSISSTVGSVKTSFEGMKVGGRNLLMGTKGKSLVVTNASTTQPNMSFSFVGNMYPVIQGGQLTLSLKASSSGFKKGTVNPWVGIELSIVYADGTKEWLPLRIQDTLPSTSDFTMYSTVIKLQNKPITSITANTLIRDTQGTVELKEWQVEMGNVATDYKPANEEIDANLNDKANNSDLEAVTKRVTNTESRITQTEGAISLRATKEELTSQINNISVGSRNLISGTEFTDTSGWIIWSDKGFRTGTWTNDLLPTPRYMYLESRNASSQPLTIPQGTQIALRGSDKTFAVRAGQEYTVSVNIATSELGNTLDYTYIMYSDSVNQKIPVLTVTNFPKVAPISVGSTVYYHRVTFTFKATKDDEKAHLLIGGNTNRDLPGDKGNGYAWIRMNALKVEKGNVATDWTKSQEDVDTNINDKVNNLSIGGNNIIPNSLFKEKGKWRDWGTAGGTRTPGVPVDIAGFSHGFQFEAPAAGEFGYAVDKIEVTQGETYTLSAWFKLTKAGTVKVQEGDTTMKWTATNATPELNKWVRITHTFVAKGTTTSLYFGQDSISAACAGFVTGAQLERGNKATDWSLSTEDLVPLTEYTKKMAELKVTTDGITSSVTSTNQRIDGISIGGANLMDNTSNFLDTRLWTLNGGTSLKSITQQDGTVVLEAVGSIQHGHLIPVKPNTEYVLTAEIMFSKDTSLTGTTPIHWWLTDGVQASGQLGLQTSKIIAPTGATIKANTWTTVSILMKSKGDIKPGAFFKFFVYGAAQLTADNKYWLKTVKFEEGNIPTAYIPSVADSSYGELYARGNGADRPGTRSVILNGKEISIPGRGHNLICIKRSDLSIVSNEVFDTHSSLQTPALVTKLNSLNDDVIIVLTTYDSGYVDNRLAPAIKRFGGSGREANKMRVPHAFIGIAGIGEGAGIEVMTDSGATSPPAEISTKIINGIPQGINIGASEALSRVASAESRITQTETSINSKVSKTDYTGATLVSMINQTAASVMIDAKNINLNGVLTISNFNSDVQSRIQSGVDAKGMASTAQTTADAAQTSANTANNTINGNKATWDRASNINSNGTFNTAKLNGTLSDAQIASANNWNSAKSLMDSWKSGTTLIDGGKIATNTIFAQQINIGDYTNLVQIDELKNPNGYATAVVNGKKYFKIGPAAYAPLTFADTTIPEFKLNDEYYIAFNGYKEAAVGNVTAIIRMFYTDGTWENAGSVAIPPTASDTRVAKNLKITKEPDNAKTLSRVQFFLEKDSSTSGYYYIRNMEFRRRYGGDLIVDGSITASHINVDNLFASTAFINKLKAQSISANQISGGTIDGVTFTSKGTVGNISISNGTIAIDNGKTGTSNVSVKLDKGELTFNNAYSSANIRYEYVGGANYLTILSQDAMRLFTFGYQEFEANKFTFRGPLQLFTNNDNPEKVLDFQESESIFIDKYGNFRGGPSSSSLATWSIKDADQQVRLLMGVGKGSNSSTDYRVYGGAHHSFYQNNRKIVGFYGGGDGYYNSAIVNFQDEAIMKFQADGGAGKFQFVNLNGSQWKPLEAGGFNNKSSFIWKTDIKNYEDDALSIIKNSDLMTYKSKPEDTDVDLATLKTHVGLIAEFAPEIVRSEGGYGVDLYAMISVAWRAIQQLAYKIDGKVNGDIVQ